MQRLYTLPASSLLISGAVAAILFIFPLHSYSQRFEWVNFTPILSGYPNGGSGGDALTIDNEGNIYTMADFGEAVIAGEDTISPIYPGSSDLYLTKWSPQGNVLWARPFGGSWYDAVRDIAFDQVNEKIYASCFIQGAQTVMTDTTYANSSEYQIIVFDTDGNFIGTRFVGWSNVALAIRNEVIYFSDNWNTLKRIDPAGNTRFSLSPSSATGYFFFTSVNITPQNDLLAAGIFSGSFTIGDVTVTSVAAPSGEHTFLLKADSAGQLIFAKYIGALDLTYYQKIPLTSDDLGNTYLSDNYSHDGLVFGNDTLPFTGTTRAGFIASFDTQGNSLWGKSFYGTSDTRPYDMIFRDGNIYHCGAYIGPMTYGTFSLPNSGNYMGYLAKMDASGNYLYATELGTYNGSSWAAQIGTGSNSKYFLSGITYGGGANSVFGCYTQAYSNQYLTAFNDTVTIVPEVTISLNGAQLISTDNCDCSIQWYLNGYPIEGATGENLVVTGNGDYYSLVRDDFNCSDQSNTITITNTGTIELSAFPVTIRPNPFSSIITVDLDESTLSEDMILNILNLSGQRLYTVSSEEWAGQRILDIDLSTLKDGMYLLELISPEGRRVKKIVKTN